VEIDSQVYHGYIVSDKAMKVGMIHCGLRWEIPKKGIDSFITGNSETQMLYLFHLAGRMTWT
jgi:hypothetical protein